MLEDASEPVGPQEVPADLMQAALAARDHAHAPYSGFRVGAAVRGASGRVYGGCNVENASYPEGWCAETTALAHMIAAGETVATEVIVLASGDRLCTPCGGCRQRLAEFAGPETPVYVTDLDGIGRRFTLARLLPAAFALHGAGREPA